MAEQVKQEPSKGRLQAAPDAQLELRIGGLRKHYGETKALDGLDLCARAGEVLGIAGPNGAGKSTLVRVIAGEAVEDAGELSLGGRRWGLAERRHAVAVVHQEPQLFPTLTVAENLVVGVEGTRLARPRTGRTQRELVQSLGIGDLLDTPVEQCSLVSQQLVEIARAVLREASVFLFDEPNSALTVEESARLFDHIRHLREQARCPVLLVTHRLADLVDLCDRVAVVRDGRVAGELVGSDLTTANLGQGIAGTWAANGASDLRPGGERFRGTSGGVAAATSKGTSSVSRGEDRSDEPTVAAAEARVLLSARGWSDAAADAFSDIDIEVRAGEALVITGQEASGGRELVRSLAGLRRARGALEIDGASSASARRRALCYVPADRAVSLFQNFSVAANLAGRLGRGEIATRTGLLQVSKVMSRADELVRRLSVRTASSRNVITSLSGGNQQKVSVGAALAAGPRVLLVEEPTRGVDVTTKQEIYASLREYLREGNAMIVFSPEVEDLYNLGDSARVMVGGRLSGAIAVAEVGRLEDLARWVDAVATGELHMETGR